MNESSGAGQPDRNHERDAEQYTREPDRCSHGLQRSRELGQMPRTQRTGLELVSAEYLGAGRWTSDQS